MTPAERQILEEAEAQAFESASAENQSLTTGIRPAPGVEGTESVLDGQLFGLDFQEDPDAATSIPGASAPEPATGCTCCFVNRIQFDCDITVTVSAIGHGTDCPFASGDFDMHASLTKDTGTVPCSIISASDDGGTDFECPCPDPGDPTSASHADVTIESFMGTCRFNVTAYIDIENCGDFIGAHRMGIFLQTDFMSCAEVFGSHTVSGSGFSEDDFVDVTMSLIIS